MSGLSRIGARLPGATASAVDGGAPSPEAPVQGATPVAENP